jgi:hypothetical protein
VRERHRLPNVRVIPNSVAIRPHSMRPAQSGRLLFVGSLSYAPNEEGLIWFIERVCGRGPEVLAPWKSLAPAHPNGRWPSSRQTSGCMVLCPLSLRFIAERRSPLRHCMQAAALESSCLRQEPLD